MRTLKNIIAIILLVLGIALCIYHAIHGNWLSAATAFISALLAGFAWAIGQFESSDMPLWQFGAAAATGLSIISVFLENRAFDTPHMEAHIEAVEAFAYMDMTCRSMDTTLRALRDDGIKACALQSSSDQLSAISELPKAIVFGPTLSIIDGIHSAARQPHADWCAEVYKATTARCPTAFLTMKESSRQVLSREK